MSFERGPMTGADLEDLDLEAAHAYASRRAPALAERLPREELLMRLGLARAPAGRVEVHTSPREVLVVLPSSLARPALHEQLS